MKSTLTRLLPNYGKKIINKFYLYTFFSNGWFVLSNWVFYFSKYISLPEIGIIDGLAILIGIIAEIPTGAIADLFGKRNTLILGRLFNLLGIIFILFGSSFFPLLIGNCFIFIAQAFSSGSKEALIYDSLIEHKIEPSYVKIMSITSSIALIATVFVTATGGLLYGLNPKLPWIAWIVFEVISILILISIKEPKVDTYKFNLKNYFKQNKEGFLHIFNSNMRPALFLIFPVLLFENVVSGIVRQGIGGYFGFDGSTFGYLLSIAFLITAFITYRFDKLKKIIQETGLVILTLCLYLIGFFLSATGIVKEVFGGGFIVILFSISQIFCSLTYGIIANKRIESRYRATSLSSLAFFNKIPYIIIALFFASSIEIENIHNFFSTFTFITGMILAAVTITAIFKYSFNTRNKQVLS